MEHVRAIVVYRLLALNLNPPSDLITPSGILSSLFQSCSPANRTFSLFAVVVKIMMKITLYTVFVASLCGSASSFSTQSVARRHQSCILLHADSTSTTSSSSSSSFAAFANSLEEEPHQEEQDESWQERLEMLLDPLTPLAQRQILLSELMASNRDIQQSVTDALRERNVSLLYT